MKHKHRQKLPLLTLKYGSHPEHSGANMAQPRPLYLLKRRRSDIQCAVYVKHPRRPYLGTSADPSPGAEWPQFGTRASATADKSRARGALPKINRREALKP